METTQEPPEIAIFSMADEQPAPHSEAGIIPPVAIQAPEGIRPQNEPGSAKESHGQWRCQEIEKPHGMLHPMPCAALEERKRLNLEIAHTQCLGFTHGFLSF